MEGNNHLFLIQYTLRQTEREMHKSDYVDMLTEQYVDLYG